MRAIAAEAMKRTAKAGQNVQLLNEVSDDENEEAFADKEIQRLFKESAVVPRGMAVQPSAPG